MSRLICFLLLCVQPLNAGWLDRKAEGWAWYEEENKKSEEEVVIPIQVEQTALEKLEAGRKQLELLLAEAIINPSQDNLLRYMEAQKLSVQQSAQFASQWGKILLNNPALDSSATTFATTQYGRQLQKSIENEQKEELIRSIASQYGLFFLYEGNSKTSKAFAMVVKAFTEKYKWTVIGIPVDGIELEEIAINTKSDLAERAGINVFPALLAFDPQTQEVIPLAFGLKAMDQIENNVVVQFSE